MITPSIIESNPTLVSQHFADPFGNEALASSPDRWRLPLSSFLLLHLTRLHTLHTKTCPTLTPSLACVQSRSSTLVQLVRSRVCPPPAVRRFGTRHLGRVDWILEERQRCFAGRWRRLRSRPRLWSVPSDQSSQGRVAHRWCVPALKLTWPARACKLTPNTLHSHQRTLVGSYGTSVRSFRKSHASWIGRLALVGDSDSLWFAIAVGGRDSMMKLKRHRLFGTTSDGVERIGRGYCEREDWLRSMCPLVRKRDGRHVVPLGLTGGQEGAVKSRFGEGLLVCVVHPFRHVCEHCEDAALRWVCMRQEQRIGRYRTSRLLT